ncbi:MAG: succinate dehydrogenase iron-sulfur subunit [Deltaproteobacteria bacterium]|nr:succinate dehydrogenase iron-sulfur subunit [Deltaproteobacteria bacterium]MCL5792480.1 succinate dehydrogenase iron-sulfur subunit [Deltaproteobacteria bacterium]
MKVQIKIKRYDPENDRTYYQEYSVDAEEQTPILNCLNDIKWHQDETLAFRRSCGHAICGSCAMKINGKNGLACQTLIKDTGENVTIEPLPSFPIIKDMVVDLDKFYNKFIKIKPYLINDEPLPDRERLQSPEEQALIEDASKCILCGACTSSCPSFWADDEYIGPAALVKAYRYIFDTRDTSAEERLNLVNDKHGVFRCHTIFNCMEACPKEIKITEWISKLKVALATTRL